MHMKISFVLTLVLGLALANPAIGQEAATDRQAYDLRVVEIPTTQEAQDRLVESGAEQLNLAMREAEWRETISCTLILEQKTKVMFGKTVALVSGVSNSSRGTVRQMRQQNIGTAMQATLSRKEESFLLKLAYQSSRLDGPQLEDAPPPGIQQTVFESPVELELGTPKIVATTPHSCLIVTVQKERESRVGRFRN